MTQTRQLAAIMFTDIVGYTALMGQDEQKAFELLQANRELQKPIIEQYGGKWIKELGDGVLASFNTVSDAVNAAIKIQNDCNNLGYFKLRIGIHLGEVIFENEDVFGDGVNIASRIQALASVGGIWVSESVYLNVINKKEIETKYIKTEKLKNVNEPVKIFEVKGNVLQDVNISKSATNASFTNKKPTLSKQILTAIAVLILLVGGYFIYSFFKDKAPHDISKNHDVVKSIVVLPFVNMSNDKEQEYFSDGLSEEIITNLSKIQTLKVISRTSAMHYKGTLKALKEIVAELNVQYVLEGSIRKNGNDIRITAQLINASQDANLWGEQYAGTLDDVFQIQEQVASKIASALQLHLSPDEHANLRKRFTASSEAYQEYLQGRYHWNKRTEQSLKNGMEHFRRAIEKDSLYALAYVGLADSYLALALLEFIPPREAFPNAKAAVEKAILIDPNIAEAYASSGVIKFQYEWDWRGAELAFKKAITLNPNYGTAHHYYADYLKAMGRFKEALEEIKKAQEIDPLSLAINTGLGHVLYLSRQYDQAIEQYRKTLELDPNFLPARLWFGRPYLQKGMYQDAIGELKAAVELSHQSTMSLAMLGHAYAASGNKSEGLKVLDILMKRSEQQYVPSYWIGMIYIGLGDRDQAFSWFGKAWEERSCWMAWIKVEPRFDSLRSDPRFEVLLKKMGLDP